MKRKVRTRIPPSPTGCMHVGTARTALFNYLFAKKEGGDFILRIEDTDKARSKKEYEEDILEQLQWLGLEWDEGLVPNNKEKKYRGPHAPYRQSERTEIYKRYVRKLLDEGRAYWCFCSVEELQAQRAYQLSIGETPRYKGVCRNLSHQQQQRQLAAGKRGVIRFTVESKPVLFHDLIRGDIKFDASLMGDIVIAKDLENPLYNFTVVVDDFEMEITHVIRGEDHIANTPKQILIQEALGLPKVRYAHLPLVLGPDRAKLSKRHGDTSIRALRAQGYVPEALVNFLALLGWNPGDERELFSLGDLVKEFSLNRIQKGGAVFNIRRLDWLNGMYLRRKSMEELLLLCEPYLPKNSFNGQARRRIVALYQERLKKLSEISELADFFFSDTVTYSKDLLPWKDATGEQTKQMLEFLKGLIDGIKESEWAKEKLEQVIMPEAEKTGPPDKPNRGYMLWPLRVALSGKAASPGPFEIAEILGKEKTLKRISFALHLLEVLPQSRQSLPP